MTDSRSIGEIINEYLRKKLEEKLIYEMNLSRIFVAWVLIALVATYDAWFSLYYFDYLEEWERNPIAIIMFSQFGYWVTVTLKMIAVGWCGNLAILLARKRMDLSLHLTLLPGFIHFLIFLVYAKDWIESLTRN